jgi:sterol 14-demethylase
MCRVQIVPRDRSLPPEVFHWIPVIGSAISYGHDPLKFFFECREKVWVMLRIPFSSSHILLQYGDVFTFTLLGRKVTVALGTKGNNFVLGGKSTAFSAADAYTV